MTINGNLYDWESIEIALTGLGVVAGMTEISYSDERGVEPRYGRGSIPRGYGLKNYKASGNGVLDKDEYDRLRVQLGGSLYTKEPWNITVNYANNDSSQNGTLGYTDTLTGVHVTKQDLSAKQDDDNAGQVKIDFVILDPIKWNKVRAYAQNRTGAVGSGTGQVSPAS